MKKILCYVTLVFAFGGLISESMNDFMNLKLIYYNLHPDKYYEKDKLYIYKKEENNSTSSSGSNSWYYGTLEKQKTKDNIYYSRSYLKQNTLSDSKGEYLKVWYCKKAQKMILREDDKLSPEIYFSGIIIYALIIMIIPCLITITKKSKNEN
ncbi:hypothetical protein ACHRVW_17130 [Flavobacterium collinsii]|jgi:hypothetical protein|uniref:hypothetical protein n=1 Tax=Flavobacterium collinsii TaxID=1114861 RepID=UPI00375779E0